MPWALTIRPTSRRSPANGLIHDVEAGSHAFPRAGGGHDLAQRLGDPAAPADHLPHVGRRHVEAQFHLAGPALRRLHEYPVGVVDDVAGDVLQHALGEAADDPVALGADLVNVLVVLHREVDVVLVVELVAGVELVAVSAFGGHFFPALCCPQAPEIVSSRWTCSVGWAPLRSHSSARSLSISTRGGSSLGPYFPMISTKRPSRGDRASATTTRYVGCFFLPIRIRRILTTDLPPFPQKTTGEVTARELHLPPPRDHIPGMPGGRPGKRGRLPPAPDICFIIPWTILNCFRRAFTSWVVVPLP